MGKREYYHYVKCSHDECKETGFYTATSRRELSEIANRNRVWKCVRHTAPNEVLSEESPNKRIVLTVIESNEHNYWANEDGKLGSGFVYGSGYKAYASDFHVGTKLVITVELIPAQKNNMEAVEHPATNAGSQPGKK